MAEEIWTIKRCLDWTRSYLGDRGDERPRLSAEWLLSHVTGLSRTQLYMRFDEPLSSDELAAMHGAVARRAKGEPLQYICGETTFRTIDVACEPGVLIPRPETELLVEEVLAWLDREVLGGARVGDGAAGMQAEGRRKRVELPWNAEVEAARKAEEAAARAKAGAERAHGAEVVAEPEDDAKAEIENRFGGEEGAAGVEAVVRGVERDGATIPGTVAAQVGGSGSARGSARDDAGDARAVAARVDSPGSDIPGPAASKTAFSVPRMARVLEVGTGTGCISLSIAHERAGRVTCIATDIEPKAVALTQRNRDALGIAPETVDIRLGNLVSPLDRSTEWGTFDVLVSNPPYIPRKVMAELPREVADFEPALALDGGEDGLDIFRRLVKAAPHMLRDRGLLACELHEECLGRAADLCRAAGFEDVRVADDLAGRPRIVLACVPAAEGIIDALAGQSGRADSLKG